MTERKIIVPGEIIVSGDEYLPGEGTEKNGNDIIALKYGLSEESNNLVKVIPLSGAYSARRGNVVIGKVESINFNGWVLDIGAADTAFLSLMEVPRYVNKDALEEVLKIGDMAVLKIWSINKRGVDLSLKQRGLGKIEQGLIVNINANKVPRVIGKEGSMIKLIKDETGCNITVGQNGFIWITGKDIGSELFAKKAIEFIEKKSSSPGLTEEVEKFLKENKK
ncbi:KH domain-containing protein [archaeon]|jgi:exosome complex component RRP4|nr:KH domain-containing protein [archaeon]